MKKSSTNYGLKAGVLRSKINGFVRKVNSENLGIDGLGLKAKVCDGSLVLVAEVYIYPRHEKTEIGLEQRDQLKHMNKILKKIQAEFGGDMSKLIKDRSHAIFDSQTTKYAYELSFKRGR